MLKQDAIDLFNKGDLVASKIIFEKLNNSSTDVLESIFALEYLVKICSKIEPNKMEQYQKKLLENYHQQKEIAKFLALYKGIKNKSFKLERIYLEILWERKDLLTFDQVSKKLSEKILTQKKFVYGAEFYNWLKKNRKWFLYPHFGSLVMSLELQSFDVALGDIDVIMDLLDNKWSKIEHKRKDQKDYYFHLYELLKSYELNNIELLKKVRLVRCKSAILNPQKIQITKKEIIDYLISFSKDVESLIWLLPLVTGEVQLDLLNYIKSIKNNFKFSSESPFKRNIGKFFEKTKSIKIAKTKDHQYYPASYNIEGTVDIYDEKIFEEYHIKKDEHEIVAERYFVSLMKLTGGEFAKKDTSIIIALIELGLYEPAKIIINRSQKTIDLKYLKAEILYREQSYPEVIVEVNNVFEENLLSQEQRIPFYYLKAQAYLKMNKKESAQNLLSIISSFNPDFRLLREKMFNE